MNGGAFLGYVVIHDGEFIAWSIKGPSNHSSVEEAKESVEKGSVDHPLASISVPT